LSLIVLLLSFLWAWIGTRGLSGKLKKPGQRCFAASHSILKRLITNNNYLPKTFLKLKVKTDLPEMDSRFLISLTAG